MTRVRIIGGPWPKRIGHTGTIVDPPQTRSYPWAALGKKHVVVLLDSDPYGYPYSPYPEAEQGNRGWTCVIGRDDVEVLPQGSS